VATAGKQATAAIRTGAITEWNQLRDLLQPFLQSINPLIQVIRSSEHPLKDKLVALGEVLVQIAILALTCGNGGINGAMCG
jgi:hypothetical protein